MAHLILFQLSILLASAVAYGPTSRAITTAWMTYPSVLVAPIFNDKSGQHYEPSNRERRPLTGIWQSNWASQQLTAPSVPPTLSILSELYCLVIASSALMPH